MIFRPVSPQSPCGTADDEAAGGVDIILWSPRPADRPGMRRLNRPLDDVLPQICSMAISGACWVEMTTVSTRLTGLAVVIFHGHLALAVRAADRAARRSLRTCGQPPGQLMGTVRWARASALASRRRQSRTSCPGRRRRSARRPSSFKGAGPRPWRYRRTARRWRSVPRRCCRRSRTRRVVIADVGRSSRGRSWGYPHSSCVEISPMTMTMPVVAAALAGDAGRSGPGPGWRRAPRRRSGRRLYRDALLSQIRT